MHCHPGSQGQRAHSWASAWKQVSSIYYWPPRSKSAHPGELVAPDQVQVFKCSAAQHRQPGKGSALVGASGEAGLQDPLLAAAIKAQQLVAPAGAVALAALPEIRLCLQSVSLLSDAAPARCVAAGGSALAQKRCDEVANGPANAESADTCATSLLIGQPQAQRD